MEKERYVTLGEQNVEHINNCPECTEQLLIDNDTKYQDYTVYICVNGHRSIFTEAA